MMQKSFVLLGTQLNHFLKHAETFFNFRIFSSDIMKIFNIKERKHISKPTRPQDSSHDRV